jgi:F-type H+-transporting ATPase subunit alpha
VELLKQGQYVPMPVEKQVVSIFVGTNGYLDEIPLGDVQRFEKELHESIALKNPEILTTISQEKDLSKQTVDSLHAIVKEFVGRFKSTVH